MVEFTVHERIDWYHTYDNNSYPLYVAEIENVIVGYCTISPYRQGRAAMSSVAEISYYLDYAYHEQGIGTALIKHAIADCKRIGKENLLAILLDINTPSIGLLEKLNFKKWGHFPDIIDLHGKKCGQLIYGLKISTN
jgi:phosphinothricin acetyltransferase